MTRKKTKFDVLDVDLTGKPSDERAPDPIDPQDQEVNEVFSDFPQNEACLELFRTTALGGKPAFIEELMPSEFSFGYVCKAYGGGKYIVKGHYKDGSYIKRSFEIEGDSYPIKRRVPVGMLTPEPQQAAPQARPAPELQVIRDERTGQPDMMATMLSMMKTLVTELKSSEDQVLDKMMKYKALFGSSDQPKSTVAEAIGMIKTGIELGSSANAGEGGFPWLMALDKLQGPLTELASTIKYAVTKQPPSLAAVPHAPIQPTIQPAQPTAAPQQEPPNMEMILKGALAHVLPNLVTGAAKEADPGFYADFLLDQIPRRFYATAKTWLEKPDCLDQLKQMNPGVAEHADWFLSLQRELINALNEELGGDVGTVQPEQTPNAPTERATDLSIVP